MRRRGIAPRAIRIREATHPRHRPLSRQVPEHGLARTSTDRDAQAAQAARNRQRPGSKSISASASRARRRPSRRSRRNGSRIHRTRKLFTKEPAETQPAGPQPATVHLPTTVCGRLIIALQCRTRIVGPCPHRRSRSHSASLFIYFYRLMGITMT
eukprot:140807-Prymnesium_polylepis.1